MCDSVCSSTFIFPEMPILCLPFQKFGTIRADLIEQMRFKQRLKVIQTLEDTTKRNVVSPLKGSRGWGRASHPARLPPPHCCLFSSSLTCFGSVGLTVLAPSQVRTIVTETSFTMDELEELYALFKVRE